MCAIPTPFCSVIVCTRHRPKLLARCLEGVRSLDYPTYEVIVVDNTRGNPVAEGVASRCGARYVREPRVGAARARNAGALAAHGRIVAFIDDDAVPDAQWLGRHADALADPAVVATAGRVLILERATPGARSYDAVGAEDVGVVPFRLTRGDPNWFEIANFGGIVIGANMAFKRALFAAGWGLREDIGPPMRIQGEEHYAFFDLLRRGHSVEYVPDAIVRHERPATVSGVRARRRRILCSSSAYLVMLVVEEKGFRASALRYAVTALSGRRRKWRRVTVQGPFATRSELVAAALFGPVIYGFTRTRQMFSRAR